MINKDLVVRRRCLFIYCGLDDPEGESAVERLHELGEGYLLVDLAIAPGLPPFLAPGSSHELSHSPMVPNRHFDGIVYLDYSRRMTPLFLPSACSPEGAPFWAAVRDNGSA